MRESALVCRYFGLVTISDGLRPIFARFRPSYRKKCSAMLTHTTDAPMTFYFVTMPCAPRGPDITTSHMLRYHYAGFSLASMPQIARTHTGRRRLGDARRNFIRQAPTMVIDGHLSQASHTWHFGGLFRAKFLFRAARIRLRPLEESLPKMGFSICLRLALPALLAGSA